MLAFSKASGYQDYVRKIEEGLKDSSTNESLNGYPNQRGLEELIALPSEYQEKAMSTLRKVDRLLDFSQKEEELYRKLTYFLKVGILFGEHFPKIEKLNAEEIATLAIDSHFSLSHPLAGDYITVLADPFLLQSLKKDFKKRLPRIRKM